LITEETLFSQRDRICKIVGANKIYTLKEFRELFNVSYPYIYKLLREGKLPQFAGKIGRFVFYTDKEVQEVKTSGIFSHKLLKRG